MRLGWSYDEDEIANAWVLECPAFLHRIAYYSQADIICYTPYFVCSIALFLILWKIKNRRIAFIYTEKIDNLLIG